MKRLLQLAALLTIIHLSSCVAIFMPANQRITVHTQDREAVVYADDIEIGKGRSFQARVRKKGVQQVVVQTPDHKDEHYILFPDRRPIGFYPLILLDVPFLFPLMVDLQLDKGFSYSPVNLFRNKHEFLYRGEDQKFIRLDAISLNIQDRDRNLNHFTIRYTRDLDRAIRRAEENLLARQRRADARASRRSPTEQRRLEREDEKLTYDNTVYSEHVKKTLKNTGYVDTINRVFSDNNNTLVLSGEINRANLYLIQSKERFYYQKAKMNILWKVKNAFGEIIDSIEVEEFSGDFITDPWHQTEKINTQRMLADAVDVSFQELLGMERFQKHLRAETDFSIDDPVLSMPKVTNEVKEISHALTASVIIKRKDQSHGSGFAISNDGYIITNYHVIAGNRLDKQHEISVVLSDGREIPVEIVRFNRMRDVALLKVDHEFDYAFVVSDEKSFENHQEILAAGAPRSVELGQSVSNGLLSNERVFGNTTLLQLSISINPGNSGGPLFERNGALHGIVTSKLVGFATEGVGFAIPSYFISDYLNLSF